MSANWLSIPPGGNDFAGGLVLQTYSGLFWFAKLFAERPVASVLEIGSCSGFLALLFSLHCPGQTVTVDIVPPAMSEKQADLYRRLGITFMGGDALQPELAARLMAAQARPRFVFCDNGAKLDEFRLYVPLLDPGDIIAVHDNPTEFPADSDEVSDLARRYRLARWRREELDADGTLLAVWQKST
jgi:predicted O-methyltransferase YrrM